MLFEPGLAKLSEANNFKLALFYCILTFSSKILLFKIFIYLYNGNQFTSKSDVKNYLKEVKNKLETDRFKKFITQIKALTKNKNIAQKNIIILQIKNI